MDLVIALAARYRVARMQLEEGATAVEYGMLVALIAAVVILTVKALGTKLIPGFTTVEGQLP